jgi:solute carrier family 35 (GDP-fucose transporter), member C1
MDLRPTITALACAGVALFTLTLATFLQISVTSPTTHVVVAAARGVAQSLLAIAILGEISMASRYLGLGLVIMGSSVYAWGKDRTLRGKEREQQESQEVKAEA